MNVDGPLAGAFPRRVTSFASALATCLLLILTILNSPAPRIDRAFGETTVFISADRAWTLFPGDCVRLRWRLEGIASLHVDGAGKIGADEMRYCPAINATSPLFEVRAQAGIYRSFRLNIHHLPDLLFYLLGIVTFVGAPLLAVYYFFSRALERPLPIYWLVIGVLALSVLGGWLRLQTYEPRVIDEVRGDSAIRMWAEHDHILFPHDCVDVRWSVIGARSVRFNGRAIASENNPAQAEHCAEDGETARLEVANVAGDSASYALPIHSLFPHRSVPPPYVHLSLVGIVLSLLIYGPLAARHAQWFRSRESRADAAAILGCFTVVLVLYLPFGFDSSAHWEAWIIHGYTEGGTLSYYATEAISRPWVNLPRTLAHLISSETFVGYHLVNYGFYAGSMALLYIILRQLGVSTLYAFLTAMLFMFYPVNDDLMSLRRLPNNFSTVSLLLAGSLFLDYCRKPRRLTLLGLWLGLLFCVGSNETGYGIILVAPLLLWLRDGRLNWRRMLNLSAIWYLAPAFKIAFVILLLASGREFYQSGLIGAGADSKEQATVLDIFVEVVGAVYERAFVLGWQDALAALGANRWWLPTIVALAVVGVIAWFHIRESRDEQQPTRRQHFAALICGLALVIAAIGVLMWVPFYRGDSWRIYMLVPIGASVAVFSLILLIVSPIGDYLRRNVIVVGCCLLLLAPAGSRLFAQHGGFIESAHSKARILHQLLEIAPDLAQKTQIALVTEMDNKALREMGIGEFLNNDMLNSALHVLYQDGAPEYAYFCHSIKICGEFSGGETIFSSAAREELLQRTLVFRLHEDLSVALVEEPAAYLGLDIEAPYDAGTLYNADAPLPPRARTMLAAALR